MHLLQPFCTTGCLFWLLVVFSLNVCTYIPCQLFSVVLFVCFVCFFFHFANFNFTLFVASDFSAATVPRERWQKGFSFGVFACLFVCLLDC